MNRRQAISNLVVLSIGAAVLPSCNQGDKKEAADVKLKNFTISGSEMLVLSQLSETIIPKTNFIGAADVKAHEFTLMMVDECYDPDSQKKYLSGMRKFTKNVKDKYGTSFPDCTPVQKKEWITTLENGKDTQDELLFFYTTTKGRTVQAFTSSQQYMTDVQKYKMVPGSNFKGCVPVTKA